MRKMMVVLAALTGLAFLAACARPTPAPTPAPAPTPGPVTAPTPTPRAATPTPTPVAAPRPTGELRVAISYLAAEVPDPSLNSGSALIYERVLFDPLVGGNADGTLSKETGLAQDWKVEHSATSSTYTFFLRRGVKFHNGDEVTAEDVKFSLEHFMRPRSVATYVGTLREAIKSIDTPDPYTVVIRTKKPFGLLHYYLSGAMGNEGLLLPSKYIKEKGEDHFNLSPIGSGPYRFKEQVIGSYVRYEAVERHWRVGVPKFKTVTFFLISEETTRIAALKVGQADIIEVSRDRVKEVTGAGFSAFLKPGGYTVGPWLNQQWDPKAYLADKRVREALNLAIKWDEVKNFIFEGQVEVRGHSLFSSSMALGYEPIPPYPYDPERTKKLLAEAFHKGVELDAYSFNLVGVPELPRVTEALAAMWTSVGVKVKIIPVEYVSYRTKMSKKELFNSVSGMRNPNSPFPIGLYRVAMHSKGFLTSFNIPELDRLIETAENEPDIAKFGKLQWEVAKYVRANHLYGGSWEVGAPYAANPKKVPRWGLGNNRTNFDIDLEEVFTRK